MVKKDHYDQIDNSNNQYARAREIISVNSTL